MTTSFDQDNANGLCCGYFATDLNGDGFVDGSDYPLFDTNNSMGFYRYIHNLMLNSKTQFGNLLLNGKMVFKYDYSWQSCMVQ
ncbi:MAG: hypothetical protein IPH33_14640 [Bacteroidetes bacterium]|nr:hypothetical protein [Bacteroidota bacterium]